MIRSHVMDRILYSGGCFSMEPQSQLSTLGRDNLRKCFHLDTCVETVPIIYNIYIYIFIL